MESNRDNNKKNRFERIDEILNDRSFDDLIESENTYNLEEDFPGSVDLTFDPMKMKAFLEIKAPKKTVSKLTYESIKEVIFNSKIERSFINWEVVKKLYTKVVVQGRNCSKVVIAKGDDVTPHIPEHIIPKSSLSADFRPSMERNGSVDYHHINSFISVKKYEFLADIVPEVPGKDGRNLLGKKIPFPTIVKNNISYGDNLYISSNRIYSAIEGTYKVVDDKIIVDPCLNIESDVNYETGDLEFNGDIDIEGSVREGFKVKSKGDLRVGHSIEPSSIYCGNNLYVNEGIWGAPDKALTCNGDIFSCHIENAEVKASGSLHITKSIMNSSINSLGKLIMPKKSKIVGGHLSCQNGIITGDIGSKSGTETKISLGIDFMVEEKLALIQNTIVRIIDEMKGLQSSLGENLSSEEKVKTAELHLALKSRLNTLVNHSKALLYRLDRNDKCTLEAYGTVYPGTYIEICHVSFAVTSELYMVKFSLKKELGEIIAESIR